MDDAITSVVQTFKLSTSEGGVVFRDKEKNLWIEEYLVNPPTHILNGFIWGLWGLYDYWLQSKDTDAKAVFDKFVKTLRSNIDRYDTGYWSLYELSQNRLKMLASPFYHNLHVVQLRILTEMTGINYFKEVAQRWSIYNESRINHLRCLILKILFKLFYY